MCIMPSHVMPSSVEASTRWVPWKLYTYCTYVVFLAIRIVALRCRLLEIMFEKPLNITVNIACSGISACSLKTEF